MKHLNAIKIRRKIWYIEHLYRHNDDNEVKRDKDVQVLEEKSPFSILTINGGESEDTNKVHSNNPIGTYLH